MSEGIWKCGVCGHLVAEILYYHARYDYPCVCGEAKLSDYHYLPNFFKDECGDGMQIG